MRFSRIEDWLAWLETLHPSAIELGLERVARVWRALRPHGLACPVVTVAGTNGKGSSVAMLDCILRAAGYRSGCYTSPHLLRYHERIRVDGREADDAQIVAAFARIDAARADTSLTYFEFGTLAALDIFAAAELDVVLLEVGMGGRLDAVNIVDPDVALVTTVDLDHMDWLGRDRETIALEKAGIARPGRPLVFGELPPKSVESFAVEHAVPLYVAGRDFHATREEGNWTWRSDGHRYAGLPPPKLIGQNQLRNAAAVLMTLDRLAGRLPVGEVAIRRGLREGSLPGRFQIVEGAVRTILDVAHNPQAAAELAETLAGIPCSGATHAVFGMLDDKDVSGVVAAMRPAVHVWHVAAPQGERAAPVGKIREVLLGSGIAADAVLAHRSIADAWQGARLAAGEGDRLLVFGSFLVVAEVLAIMPALVTPGTE